MDIPMRYEDVVADSDALRKDLEMFVKAQLGISISEPGESFVQTTLRLYRMSKRRAAEFGIPECVSLEVDIEAFEDYDALQQRLTVAEQRAGEFEGLLHMSKELLTTISRHGATTKPNDWCDSFKAEVADRIEKIGAALKPAAEGEGS